MILQLSINNFAIIDRAELTFGEGLNVITGETGAGKSIILQALELILGGKPKAHFVRTDTDALVVEATFDLTRVPKAILDELPDIAKGDELSVTREVSATGKGKVYINGRLGTVSLLEDISKRLISICRQGHYMRLLDVGYHAELVDSFGGHEKELDAYKNSYANFRALKLEFERIEIALRAGEAKQRELNAIIEDLTGKNIRAGIRLELEQEVKRLSSGESIISSCDQLLSLFEDADGLSSRLSQAGGFVAEILKVDSRFSDASALFNSARAELTEFESELRSYRTSIDLNEDLLNEKRELLADVARLERKYRTNDAGLSALLESANKEIGLLGDEAKRGEVESALNKASGEVRILADALSQQRKLSARKLSKEVQRELKELNMVDATFEVRFTELTECGPLGRDDIEILISTNKGEPVKPLRQIASGGELSRVMLVLKKLFRDRSGANVLVFDEVDSGISGSVARAVGEKLRELSKDSQVICITHLPQVASLAHHHFLAQKKVGKRTVSEVRALSRDERVQEVARMISGHEVTEASTRSAEELMAGNS